MKRTGALGRESDATLSLARIWLALGELETAERLMQEALLLSPEIGASAQDGAAYYSLGQVASERNDVDEAIRLAEQALRLFRKTGNGGTIADGLNFLGQLRASAGEVQAAREALQEAGELSGAEQPLSHALALAMLAGLPGEDVGAAEAAVDALGFEGLHTPQLQYLLWRATGDASHLEQAKRSLDELADMRRTPTGSRYASTCASIARSRRLGRSMGVRGVDGDGMRRPAFSSHLRN